MMILSTAASESPHGIIFLIFGAFWVFVLVVLFFGVGLLLKRHERSQEHHPERH